MQPRRQDDDVSGKAMALSKCSERPPCGSPVLNVREHHAWHERVFISEERHPARQTPRYVGEPDVDSDTSNA